MSVLQLLSIVGTRIKNSTNEVYVRLSDGHAIHMCLLSNQEHVRLRKGHARHMCLLPSQAVRLSFRH